MVRDAGDANGNAEEISSPVGIAATKDKSVTQSRQEMQKRLSGVSMLLLLTDPLAENVTNLPSLLPVERGHSIAYRMKTKGLEPNETR